PSGATASFNPSSVAAGASSTMTVYVGATTAPGTYTLTIQGTETGGGTHSTTVALTVTATQSWAATYNVTATPLSWSNGQGQGYAVTLTNIGSEPWAMGGTNPVHLGIHFAAQGGGYGTGPGNSGCGIGHGWYTDGR